MANIQLSPQLFEDIQKAIGRQEPDADQGVAMQYLAAVTGYMLGTQRSMDQAGKEAFLDELCTFARQVMNDVSAQQEQQLAQQQAAQASAFGYWQPPKN